MPLDLRITIVVENTPNQEKGGLLAQHGLSMLLDLDLGRDSLKLLWDTGASSRVLLHNVDALSIDPAEIDLICLSHGHYDHTGGLLGLLQRRKVPVPISVPIIAHPHIFAPKLKVRPYLKYIGTPFTRNQLEEAGAIILPCRDPVTLAPGVMTTGEVPRVEALETVEGFWTMKNEQYSADSIPDDQSLAIHLPGKGLVVISGCAHSGIINTIAQARKITGEDKLYAVIGGLHLMNASRERIAATAEALDDMRPKIIRPGHCTGEEAVCRLQEVLGKRCLPLAVGEIVQL